MMLMSHTISDPSLGRPRGEVCIPLLAAAAIIYSVGSYRHYKIYSSHSLKPTMATFEIRIHCTELSIFGESSHMAE